MEEKLLIGYAREKMNPPDGTPLGGYGNAGKDRPSAGKLHHADDDLYITVIAISDTEGNTVLACTLDIVRMRIGIGLELRKRMSEKTGVPVDNIFLCSTHTHSSPEVADGYDAIQGWVDILNESGTLAAEEAMADRAPSDIYIGKRSVYDLNFVRRYMKDGEFLGTNAKGGDAHETPADNTLQLIKFKREEKEDIIIINWGAHCDWSWDTGAPYGTKLFHCGISADYNYTLRKDVEKATGAKFAFFQAAAGNLNPMSAIPTEGMRTKRRKLRDNSLNYVAYGKELAEDVIILNNSYLEKVTGKKPVATKENITFDLPERFEIGSHEYKNAQALVAVYYGSKKGFTPTDESRAVAKFITDTYSLGDTEEIKKKAADDKAENSNLAKVVLLLTEGGLLDTLGLGTYPCGIRVAKEFLKMDTIYAATHIITRAHQKPGERLSADIYAFSFGDIGFALAPYEMFDTNGKAIKADSPFKMTFVCEYTNHAIGYLPSLISCKHGGYEVDCMNTAEGSAEKAERRFVAMLEKLDKNYR